MKLLLKGIGVSQGTAEGIAKVLIPGQKITNLPKDCVLVTTITDPTMINLMLQARAIITDMGGMTSHPAIIAREMGVPCVVGTKTATKIVTDGIKIFVDGTKGEIYELD